MELNNVRIIGLSGAADLAKKVSKISGIQLVDVTCVRFADGEIFVKHNDTVRHQDVVVIQSLIKPVNESVMELLICLDALKRASARSITVVLPYYAYARQDRKVSGREPISAKLLASLIETAGANHVVILDVHSAQCQGFFNVPVDTLTLGNLLVANAIKGLKVKNLVSVSPDYGGVKRAREISKLLNCGLAILDKRRPRPNEAEILNILGEVKNKDCIIADDMIDTAGTICLAAKALKKAGAKSVRVVASHGILSHPATERLTESFKNKEIEALYLANTIPYVKDFKNEHVHIVDIAEWLSGVIKVLLSLNLSLSNYCEKCTNKQLKTCLNAKTKSKSKTNN